MSKEKIKRVLDAHSVPNYEQDGKLYADCMIAFTAEFEQVEDVTGWTRKQLYDWLGY